MAFSISFACTLSYFLLPFLQRKLSKLVFIFSYVSFQVLIPNTVRDANLLTPWSLTFTKDAAQEVRDNCDKKTLKFIIRLFKSISLEFPGTRKQKPAKPNLISVSSIDFVVESFFVQTRYFIVLLLCPRIKNKIKITNNTPLCLHCVGKQKKTKVRLKSQECYTKCFWLKSYTFYIQRIKREKRKFYSSTCWKTMDVFLLCFKSNAVNLFKLITFYIYAKTIVKHVKSPAFARNHSNVFPLEYISAVAQQPTFHRR